MPVCPVCRRAFDGRFQVFVPPHYEAFDSIECARRASEAWGAAQQAPTPVILPPIEARAPVRARRRPSLGRVGLVAAVLSPAPAAVAAGISLVAAGTTASVYLWGHSSGRSPTHTTSSRTPISRIAERPAITRPQPPTPSAAAPPAKTRRRKRQSETKKHLQPARHQTPASTQQQLAAVAVQGSHSSSTGHAVTPASTPAHEDTTTRTHRAAAPGSKPPAPKRPRTKPTAPRKKPPTTPHVPPSSGSGNAGGVTPTSSTANAPQNPSPAEPSAPQPPPPPPTSTTPTSQAPLPQRPGNGWGDVNHDHTGPPGQGGGNGNGNPNGNGNGHGHG